MTAADLERAGLDVLTPLPMAPEEVAALVARAKENTEPFRIATGIRLHSRGGPRTLARKR